jgi:putative alpha-1,2-mannosidase
MTLNGKPYNKNWISHSEITRGGKIDFIMTANPNKNRGVSADAYPFSLSTINSRF